ncbi:MAG: hypothetical protein EZS28_054326, partial [Streblomastix strix]
MVVQKNAVAPPIIAETVKLYIILPAITSGRKQFVFGKCRRSSVTTIVSTLAVTVSTESIVRISSEVLSLDTNGIIIAKELFESMPPSIKEYSQLSSKIKCAITATAHKVAIKLTIISLVACAQQPRICDIFMPSPRPVRRYEIQGPELCLATQAAILP